MVHGKGAFEAVRGDMPGGPETTDVVDQHVQSRVGVRAPRAARRRPRPARTGRRRRRPPAGCPSRRGSRPRLPWCAADPGPVIPTRAPFAASPIAVALPIPPVPPVIRTTLPAISAVTSTMVSSLVARRSRPGDRGQRQRGKRASRGPGGSRQPRGSRSRSSRWRGRPRRDGWPQAPRRGGRCCRLPARSDRPRTSAPSQA